MGAPTYTYSFSNGTTADATQVNQNFTDILNGVSDGTKDLSISALTVAGTGTFNGSVTLGNASADDITITGSLAATIAIKTNNTYNIGAATLALAGIYLGAPSSRSTRLTAHQSLSASNTLVFPNGNGTANYLLKTDGSGNMSWVQPHLFVLQSKTTTYTALLTDDVIQVTTGSAWTLTLPTAVGISGKILRVTKTSSDLNALTIDGDGTETIAENGTATTTTTIHTQGESLDIVSDGANWLVINRVIPAIETAYTVSSMGGCGTLANGLFHWWRERSHMVIRGAVTTGTTTAATFTFPLPSGVTLDATNLTSAFNVLGEIEVVSSTTAFELVDIVLFYHSASTTVLYGGRQPGGSTALSQRDGNANFSTGDSALVTARIPITGWKS